MWLWEFSLTTNGSILNRGIRGLTRQENEMPPSIPFSWMVLAGKTDRESEYDGKFAR